jgi:hypothetical protein
MRNGFLGSLAALLAGAGLAFGQAGPGLAVRMLPPDQTAAPALSAATSESRGTGSSGVGSSGPGSAAGTKETSQSASTAATSTGLPANWANEMPCSSYGHFRGDAEFLFFFIKDGRDVPPLIQAGNAGPGGQIIPAQGEGNVDLAGTTGSEFSYGLPTGGRFWTSYECQDCESWGIQAGIFFLPKISTNFQVGSEFLSRPFSDATTGLENALVVAFPGLASGNFIAVANDKNWGAELNVYKHIIDDPIVDGLRVGVLAGFRFQEADEDLSVQSVTSFNTNLAEFPQAIGFAGNQIQVNDKFLTRNQFYGGQVGIFMRKFGDLGNFDARVILAMGTNDEEINITGSQVRSRPDGTTTVTPGGLLALPSNIGAFHKDQFAIIPEVDLNWNIPLGSHFAINLGYNFIYWNRMVRASDQIDRDVNPNLVPNNLVPVATLNPLPRPSVPFFQSNYYIHGFNAGFEFTW